MKHPIADFTQTLTSHPEVFAPFGTETGLLRDNYTHTLTAGAFVFASPFQLESFYWLCRMNECSFTRKDFIYLHRPIVCGMV